MGPAAKRSRSPAKDADVVDLVTRREGGVVDAALAAPVAADGEVEDQVLRLIERPDAVAARFLVENVKYCWPSTDIAMLSGVQAAA